MSLFDQYRGTPKLYRQLLLTDPRRHPWLQWGLTPHEIARAQQEERQRIAREGQRLRGFGDVVAAMTNAAGIKPCAPCKRRQAKLNRWFPFS